LEQYTALVEKLVQFSEKEELVKCERMLAANLGYFKINYGELPLGMFMADLEELCDQQAEAVVEGIETLVRVLGSVIEGLDKKTEH
jgi:hypothetical protein